MSGNRRTNKKPNRRGFWGFFLLYLLSLGLASFATYSAVSYIPKTEEEVLRGKALSQKEQEAIIERLNTKFDSIFQLLSDRHAIHPQRSGQRKNLNDDVVELYRQAETDMQSLGLNHEALVKVINLSLEVDNKYWEQILELKKIEDKWRECQDQKGVLEQQVRNLGQ